MSDKSELKQRKSKDDKSKNDKPNDDKSKDNRSNDESLSNETAKSSSSKKPPVLHAADLRQVTEEHRNQFGKKMFRRR